MAQSSEGYRSFVKVLRNRNFFWLWLSQLISLTGDFFSFLAVPYLITVLADGAQAASSAEGTPLSTEAKALVGVATLAFTAPRLLGIFTGALVDRWDRQRMMVIANFAAGGIVLTVLLVGSLADVWILVVMQFALALVTRFIQPAQSASLPQIVAEEDLMAANGLLAFNMTLGVIAGPLLAGLTVQAFGVKAAFVIDACSFLLAGGVLALKVRIPPLEHAPSGKGARAVLANIGEGLRFMLVTRLLLATVICFTLLQAALGAINAMWVPYMREAFGAGPVQITLVDTAQGLGMALGAVLLGFLMAHTSKHMIAGGGLAVIGLVLAAMGAAQALWVVVVLSLLIGLLLTPGQTAFNTLFQLAIPRQMQGRVFSSFGAITQAASLAMIGVVTGLVAIIPLRAIYIGGGLTVFVAGLLWTWLVRDDVRRLETAAPLFTEPDTEVAAAD